MHYSDIHKNTTRYLHPIHKDLSPKGLKVINQKGLSYDFRSPLFVVYKVRTGHTCRHGACFFMMNMYSNTNKYAKITDCMSIHFNLICKHLLTLKINSSSSVYRIEFSRQMFPRCYCYHMIRY